MSILSVEILVLQHNYAHSKGLDSNLMNNDKSVPTVDKRKENHT